MIVAYTAVMVLLIADRLWAPSASIKEPWNPWIVIVHDENDRPIFVDRYFHTREACLKQAEADFETVKGSKQAVCVGPDSEKGGVYLVVDGCHVYAPADGITDVTEAMQRAIDRVSSGGCPDNKVHLAPGSYQIGGKLYSSSDKLWIDGHGAYFPNGMPQIEVPLTEPLR